jgi:hypothetical protein
MRLCGGGVCALASCALWLRENEERVKLGNNDAELARKSGLESIVKTQELVLRLLDEAYKKKTWHGPNLRQAIRGVNAKQAAWRPGPGRHNIWEETLHAAYWKYTVRKRIEGGRKGSFALPGSNFFLRPEKGKAGNAAWQADKELLEREHNALRASVDGVLNTPRGVKFLKQIYGVTFHDVYHAGQIRLLRRLMSR